MALISSAFSSPALDVAWGQRRLTFAELCHDVGGSLNDRGFSHSEDVEVQIPYLSTKKSCIKWERLFFYAGKIRNIEVNPTCISSFISSMVANKQAESATSLFPRMETLEITFPFGNLGWSFLRSFCGPNLSTLRINVPEILKKSELVQLVDTSSLIHSICPQVANLALRGHSTAYSSKPGIGAKRHNESMWTTVLFLLSHKDEWRYIHLELHCIPSTTAYVEMLSRLPGLESLILQQFPSFGGSMTAKKPDSPKRASKETFQVLRNLCLAGRKPFLNSFLGAVTSPRLETLHLEIALGSDDYRNEAEVLHGVITNFVESQALNMPIRALRLSMRTTNDYQWGGLALASSWIIPMAFIAPLFAFASMQDLELSSEIEVEMDDTEVDTLASAWPNLRRLILPSRDGGSVNPSLSYLFTLASLCPHLIELSLATRPDPPLSSHPLNWPSFEHRLRVLRIRLLEAHSSMDLADWVPILFPSADFLTSMTPFITSRTMTIMTGRAIHQIIIDLFEAS